MSIWLKVGLFLLARLSSPAKEYLEKAFDYIEGKAAETGTAIDDYIVKGLRLILLGGSYKSSGTGKAEELIGSMLNKLTPALRWELYQFLLLGLEGAKSNTIEGDEVAMEFILAVLYPQGEPEKIEIFPEVSQAPRFVGSRMA